jgi:hypothetical protein
MSVSYLEPVNFDWVETSSPRMREIGRTVLMPVPAAEPRTTGAVIGHLRTTAAIVWLGFLIAAGLVVGGTALVVVARVAWTVLQWAVAL